MPHFNSCSATLSLTVTLAPFDRTLPWCPLAITLAANDSCPGAFWQLLTLFCSCFGTLLQLPLCPLVVTLMTFASCPGDLCKLPWHHLTVSLASFDSFLALFDNFLGALYKSSWCPLMVAWHSLTVVLVPCDSFLGTIWQLPWHNMTVALMRYHNCLALRTLPKCPNFATKVKVVGHQYLILGMITCNLTKHLEKIWVMIECLQKKCITWHCQEPREKLEANKCLKLCRKSYSRICDNN